MPNEIPSKTVRELTANYLRNRSEFYDALWPRIPDSAQRAAIKNAVEPIESDSGIATVITGLPDDTSGSELLRALGLRDLLKKPGYGRAQGLTTISTVEALQRAQQIEETGLLLFEQLVTDFPTFSETLASEIQRRRIALTSLLRLEDSLRYHRFPPPSD